MVDTQNIVLTAEELAECEVFSTNCAANQQAVEFGQHSTRARSQKEIAHDNLIGKIAEVAFRKMIQENFNIDVPLDFNYYPRGQWDEQDAVINGWRIDVKGTRKGGRWMLIEWSKLVFRQKENKLSHVYLMFSVDWDRQTDQPTGKVSYKGAVSLGRLNDHTPTTQILRKGTKLPGTNAYLQADNYGIQFRDLYKHLNHLVDYLTKSPPPASLTDYYRNPYTGQTTASILEELKPVEAVEAAPAVPPQESVQASGMQKITAWIKRIWQTLKGGA